MPRVPGQEPPHGEGGGAAERLRQFEQARGLRPDHPDPVVGPYRPATVARPAQDPVHGPERLIVMHRRFDVVRDTDVTGISGTGRVGEGVEFSDGSVVMRWLKAGTARPSLVQPTTVIHPDMANIEALHGHDGKTRVVWLDESD